MISLNATLNPSEHVVKRSRNMWVKTIAPDEYVVKPREKGKARRVVRFIKTQQGIKIECRDRNSGEQCPANAFKLPCSHVEAAITRLLINTKRKQNRKSKEQKSA